MQTKQLWTASKQALDEAIKVEMEEGISQKNFLSLANIAREYTTSKYNFSAEHIVEVWKNFRVNNLVQNELRLDPFKFEGFSYIKGEEHLDEFFRSGGIIATFHMGHYRYVPMEIGKRLITQDQAVNIIIDTDSYNSEKDLHEWNRLRAENNVDYIVSEKTNSALTVLRFLKRGGNIILYLDGNTGSGDDSQPIFVEFLSSKIQVRSGIYRLAAKLHKPICLAIASQDEDNNPYLEICKPIYVSEDSITDTVQTIYNKFESTLNQNIGGWRFWFRHHLQAVETLPSSNMLNPSVDFFNKDHNLGLDINSGLIYEIERG